MGIYQKLQVAKQTITFIDSGIYLTADLEWNFETKRAVDIAMYYLKDIISILKFYDGITSYSSPEQKKWLLYQEPLDKLEELEEQYFGRIQYVLWPNEIEVFMQTVFQELQRRRDKIRSKIAVKEGATGYVYLLQSPSGAYKIGCSRTPHDRLKTFEVKLPFEVEYLALIPTNDMFSLETELHSRFATRHVNGEWYALTFDDVIYIKSLEATDAQ